MSGKYINEQAVGIFDSGIGGISVWKEITKQIPFENTIYLADSKNAPYGYKTQKEIASFCIKNTEFLINKGCKIVVVACNTATTSAIEILRKSYDISFVGMEPAIKPAILKTKNKIIGVLATKNTLKSQLFAETSKKYKKDIKVIEQVGDDLVFLIENGKIESQETKILLKKYIQPMIKQKIDCLVLGCTHFPFLIPQIKKITNSKIQIIDSRKAVAKQTKEVLKKKKLLNENKKKPKHLLITNKKTDILKSIIKKNENTEVIFRDF